MANKKKVTYSVFATITVDESVDPNEISNTLQRAANNQGWHLACSVEEEPDGNLADILEEPDYNDY
jgi:hypothetical protein